MGPFPGRQMRNLRQLWELEASLTELGEGGQLMQLRLVERLHENESQYESAGAPGKGGASPAMEPLPESQTPNRHLWTSEAPPPEREEMEEVLHQHEHAFENGICGA